MLILKLNGEHECWGTIFVLEMVMFCMILNCSTTKVLTLYQSFDFVGKYTLG